MRPRDIVPPLAVVLLLAGGCSSPEGTETAETPTSGRTSGVATPTTDSLPSPGGTAESVGPGPTATEDSDSSGGATPTAGTGGSSSPVECDVSEGDVASLAQDWSRVAGGVGRPDLEEYTGPLITRVTDLTGRAADCPGAEHARRLPALARSIDRDARGDGVDFDDVDAFQTQGDAWLEALGYGPNYLPTG